MKRVLVITLTLLMLLSVVTFTGCSSNDPYKENVAEAYNSFDDNGYFVKVCSVGDCQFYYDRFSKVMYVNHIDSSTYHSSASLTALYDEDGKPIKYEEWKKNFDEYYKQELEDISDVSE